MNTMSEKLNRIKEVTTELRATAEMPYGPIEDVIAAVDNKVKTIDNTIAEKNVEIAELQKDSSVFRAKKAKFVQSTVVNPKDKDVVVVVEQTGGFPKHQEYANEVTISSIVDLGDKTFIEWIDEFYAAYGSTATTIACTFRSDDYNTTDLTGQQLTCQVRNETSMYRIQMSYRDYLTNDQLTCYYYVYEEDFESTVLTASTAYFRDGVTGTQTNFRNGGSYTLKFPQGLKLLTNKDVSALSTFLSFGGVAYDGVYMYHEDEEEWIRMPIGMNLNPENVLSGIKFKTDEGEKIGTLGDNISTLANIQKVGQVFKNSTDGKLDTGTLTPSTVFKAIQKGTKVLTPLFYTVDWASKTDYSNFFSNIELDEFDLTKMPEGILGQPTMLNNFLANTKIKKFNLTGLDVSKVRSLGYSSTPFEHLNNWLTEERTFDSLESSSGSSAGIFGSYGEENNLLTIKNRNYPKLNYLYGCFGSLSCKNILLENLTFGTPIEKTSYLFNNTKIYSLCIKNCTGLSFKYFSSNSDKSDAYRYTFTDGYTQGTLKYLIFDIDYVLNFPAYFSYTPTSIRLDPRLRECDLYTSGYIYVRDDMVTSYKNSSYWSSFSSRIKPISEMTQELKDIYGYNEEV